MNVLSIHAGQDTGGQSVRIKQAFDRHAPDWSFRSCVNPRPESLWIDYPRDLPWEDRFEAWDAADVAHVHNNLLTAEYMVRNGGQPKPLVLHYHGSMFRGDQKVLNEQRRQRAIGIVATLDLWLIAPDELEWVPSPYDLDWLASFRKRRRSTTVRIAHAPTNRTGKYTDRLVTAVERLQKKRYPVELDIIENVPWRECLRRKGRADILFDQADIGYGNNSVEVWGMGIPVVCGASDATLDEMERRFGSLPFQHATLTTIYDALRELVESPELRRHLGQRGLEHVRRFHDERVVVEQLKDIYRRAAGASEDVAA